MTVPMAFTGVVVGLLISQYPLSLYTLYGVVALAGIAVNAAIVLISTANIRLQASANVTTSIYLAARRRVIPILITSLTTIAGLFSLATGLGGSSLIWGPVAASMVFGLGVSTILTLFYIPLFYRVFMSPWRLPTFKELIRGLVKFVYSVLKIILILVLLGLIAFVLLKFDIQLPLISDWIQKTGF